MFFLSCNTYFWVFLATPYIWEEYVHFCLSNYVHLFNFCLSLNFEDLESSFSHLFYFKKQAPCHPSVKSKSKIVSVYEIWLFSIKISEQEFHLRDFWATLNWEKSVKWRPIIHKFYIALTVVLIKKNVGGVWSKGVSCFCSCVTFMWCKCFDQIISLHQVCQVMSEDGRWLMSEDDLKSSSKKVASNLIFQINVCLFDRTLNYYFSICLSFFTTS